MSKAATNQKATRRKIKSFRLTDTHLELIKQECSRRNVAFSEFVRESLLGNLRFMKRAAIESWGKG